MPEDIIETPGERLYLQFDKPEIREHFSKAELSQLALEREHLGFNKGDLIIKEGSKPLGVYCITKGTAKLFKEGYHGKEQILRFAKEGDIVGYRSILCNEPFSASAMALEDMEVEFIPEFFFHKLLEISPKLSFEMLKIVSRELGEAGRTITILAQKTVRERLAEILLLLEDKLGTDESGYIKISLTREEMANLIGTATESAIRLISEFKNDNHIEVSGRKIKIVDHEKLYKLGSVNK